MKWVEDKAYNQTFDDVIDMIKRLVGDVKPNNSGKIDVVLLAVSAFAFRQLILFVLLWVHYRNHGFSVVIVLDDKVLKHCDMLKKGEKQFSIELCNRCSCSAQKLFDTFPGVFMRVSQLIQENISINKEDKESQWLKYSLSRYSNEIDDENYYASLHNGGIARELGRYIIESMSAHTILVPFHYMVYSMHPLKEMCVKANVHLMEIEPMPYFDSRSMGLFGKSQSSTIRNYFLKHIGLDKRHQNALTGFMRKRVGVGFSISNMALLETIENKKRNGQQVVVVMPNIFEDAFWEEYHTYFTSPKEWLMETVEFLAKNDFFVIVKAHPHEKKWGVEYSSIDCLVDINNKGNLLLLDSETDVNPYWLMQQADIVTSYTGTVLLEAAYYGIPVIAGGNTYFVQEDILHPKISSKNSYFSMFFEKTKLLKHIQKNTLGIQTFCVLEFLYRELKMEYIDYKEPYPYVNVDKALKMLDDPASSLMFILDWTINRKLDLPKYESLLLKGYEDQ